MGLSKRQRILLYLHAQNPPRYTKFTDDLVGSDVFGKHLNWKVFTKHLKDLMAEGLVQKGMDEQGHKRYFLTEKGTALVGNMISDERFDDEIDSMSDEEAKQMLKELLHASVE